MQNEISVVSQSHMDHPESEMDNQRMSDVYLPGFKKYRNTDRKASEVRDEKFISKESLTFETDNIHPHASMRLDNKADDFYQPNQ